MNDLNAAGRPKAEAYHSDGDLTSEGLSLLDRAIKILEDTGQRVAVCFVQLARDLVASDVSEQHAAQAGQSGLDRQL